MRIITAKDFGKFIRIARIKAELTQAQLAAACNVGERFLRELEKGKTTCQIGKALIIAHMLGVKLDARNADGEQMS